MNKKHKKFKIGDIVYIPYPHLHPTFTYYRKGIILSLNNKEVDIELIDFKTLCKRYEYEILTEEEYLIKNIIE